MKSWTWIYGIGIRPGVRLNCLKLLPHGVLTTHTGVKIDIEDDGTVNSASTDTESAQKAIRMIEDLVMEAEIGKTYLGTVTRQVDFGAFVEIFPGTEGFLHISEVLPSRASGFSQMIILPANAELWQLGFWPLLTHFY